MGVTRAGTLAVVAMVAEKAQAFITTIQYIRLAAAKAAASLGLSTPLIIAAGAAVLAALTASLGGFDEPANDAMAKRHGEDYADNFMSGLQTRFAAPAFGGDVVGAVSQSVIPTPTGGGGATIHLHFEGPVTDERFVRDTIIPAIEDARAGRYTRLVTESDNLTGRAEVQL